MMSNPSDPHHEQPNTYIVQERTDAELIRLQVQGQLLTSSMGGVLPEQPDPTCFREILDVGCGTGEWLIQAAKAYPHLSRLVGVDASKKVIEYAQAQAEAQQVSDRVEFHVMDALLLLEFPDRSFDLVNHRLGQSFIRKWEWRKLLDEYQRILRPGGIVRITEGEALSISNSQAVVEIGRLLIHSFHQAGYYFTPQSNGLTSELPRLLRIASLQNIRTCAYHLEFHAGTPEGDLISQDITHFGRNALPFFRKWTRVPEDYEQIYQQALHDMQQPDFTVTWNLLTAWGSKAE